MSEPIFVLAIAIRKPNAFLIITIPNDLKTTAKYLNAIIQKDDVEHNIYVRGHHIIASNYNDYRDRSRSGWALRRSCSNFPSIV